MRSSRNSGHVNQINPASLIDWKMRSSRNKAHFGRPDSQSVAATFNNMLFREKVKQHENKRYFHHSVTQEAAGQTVHVGGDGVYRLG